MDDYAGRVLADRYRLPLPPSDGFELVETRAFDTYSGQEVLVRQVPLPEIVDAEVLDADGRSSAGGRTTGRAVRRSTDPAVRRAIEAAQAAAQVPDHPRLDQVFDVFAEAGSLWIVSELVAARPLAALLAERPLNPYRAAEIGSDVLTALRVLHTHGWTHRNITARTVLVCDDGRVMLTGLAAGAAEEALCGYAPEPLPDDEPAGETYGGRSDAYGSASDAYDGASETYEAPGGYEAPGVGAADDTLGIPVVEAVDADEPGELPDGRPGGPEGRRAYSLPPGESYDSQELPLVPPYVRAQPPQDDAYRPDRGEGRAPWGPGAREAREAPGVHEAPGAQEAYGAPDGQNHAPDASGSRDRAPGTPGGQELVPRPATPAVPYTAAPRPPAEPGAASAAQLRAARAGAIAAYRAGARAAARVTEDRQQAAGSTPANLAKETQEPQGPQQYAPGILPVQRPEPGTSEPGPHANTPHANTPSDNAPQATPPGTTASDVSAPQATAPGVTTPGATDPGTTAPGATTPGTSAPDATTPGTTTPAPTSAGLPGPRLTAPWGSPPEDPYDDDDDEDDEEGPRPPRRVHLAGTWDDGPGAGRPVPAGGSGADALRADSRRPAQAAIAPATRLPAERAPSSAWEEAVAGSRKAAVYRGPATPLAAERARQARIAVVGPVTERWAPEQAGPVHDNWQLAPPIGPSTDLWALGALLYRAVQGHAPYPEENAAELVQMVCAEPPAFAEECGALRPVVESLLRQDPTERPDFEELRGWLRSLVRSAPEPEAGADVVPLPAPDATRLPVVRRRGELVRRRRGRFGSGSTHGRHRQGKRQRQQLEKQRAAERHDLRQPPPRHESLLPPDPEQGRAHPVDAWEPRPSRAPREPKGPRVLREPARPRDGRSPRKLGRLLLILVLLLMAAAIAYAFMFMPKQEPGTQQGAPGQPTNSAAPPPAASGSPAPSDGTSTDPGSQQPQTSRSAVALAPGYVLRKDAEGFEVGVPKDWQRSPANADRQIRYGSDGFTLLVVPGRDTVKAAGGDPLDYQRVKEPELQPFRDSGWSTSSGLRRVDVGRQAMAEGQFTWLESGGREVFARNLVMIVDGRYHIVQVIGPVNDRDKVTEIYQQAIASYRVNP
ncbi:protein kinase [Streptomyces sp. SID8374]|uniref:protein kinase n=1 Tax=Streptomyces sp. SID8374 TaxID=2690354 RepID=UPI00136F6BA0|nr:protein kinase [Streptomyces sp. SID8374]